MELEVMGIISALAYKVVSFRQLSSNENV